MSTLNKLVIWLVVIMVVSFTLSGYFFNQFGLDLNGNDVALWFSNSSDRDWQILEEEDVDFSDIKQLQIETLSADVIFQSQNDDESSTVQLAGSAPDDAVDLELQAENDALTIDVVRADGLLAIQNLQVIIRMPSQKFENVIIETTSGDSDLEFLLADVLTVQTTSGDIEATSLKVNNVNINTESGDIHLSSLTGNLDLKTTSGDVYGYYEAFEDQVSIQTVSGDVHLTFEEPIDFELNFKTTSGDSDIGVPVQIKKSSGSHDLKAISGEGNNPINIETVSGDLRIE